MITVPEATKSTQSVVARLQEPVTLSREPKEREKQEKAKRDLQGVLRGKMCANPSCVFCKPLAVLV